MLIKYLFFLELTLLLNWFVLRSFPCMERAGERECQKSGHLIKMHQFAKLLDRKDKALNTFKF